MTPLLSDIFHGHLLRDKLEFIFKHPAAECKVLTLEGKIEIQARRVDNLKAQY